MDAAVGIVVTKRVIVPRTPAGIVEQGESARQDEVGRVEGQMIRPSSEASLKAAASSPPSVDSQPPLGTRNTMLSQHMIVSQLLGRYLQTQKFGRFLLVMTRTLPAALAIGMAQHTTLGVERPFVDMTRME